MISDVDYLGFLNTNSINSIGFFFKHERVGTGADGPLVISDSSGENQNEELSKWVSGLDSGDVECDLGEKGEEGALSKEEHASFPRGRSRRRIRAYRILHLIGLSIMQDRVRILTKATPTMSKDEFTVVVVVPLRVFLLVFWPCVAFVVVTLEPFLLFRTQLNFSKS